MLHRIFLPGWLQHVSLRRRLRVQGHLWLLRLFYLPGLGAEEVIELGFQRDCEEPGMVARTGISIGHSLAFSIRTEDALYRRTHTFSEGIERERKERLFN